MHMLHQPADVCVSDGQGHTLMVYSTSRQATVDATEGRLLMASGSQDCHVRVWNVINGECIQLLVGHTEPVLAVSSLWESDDGHFGVASAGEDRSVRVWNVATAACLVCIDASSVHGDDILALGEVSRLRCSTGDALPLRLRLVLHWLRAPRHRYTGTAPGRCWSVRLETVPSRRGTWRRGNWCTATVGTCGPPRRCHPRLLYQAGTAQCSHPRLQTRPCSYGTPPRLARSARP